MEYQGFWLGLIGLFGVLPVLVGVGAGMIWARRKGWRGTELLVPAICGGVGFGICFFLGAVLFFRA
ncbi:MAG: hypothetical protein OEU46_04805 [Alphaproteobacteria bacterium]|nr:hypothetical protein [Alphaproteobacteria bacterium]